MKNVKRLEISQNPIVTHDADVFRVGQRSPFCKTVGLLL